jgi:hypothetical protein
LEISTELRVLFKLCLKNIFAFIYLFSAMFSHDFEDYTSIEFSLDRIEVGLPFDNERWEHPSSPINSTGFIARARRVRSNLTSKANRTFKRVFTTISCAPEMQMHQTDENYFQYDYVTPASFGSRHDSPEAFEHAFSDELMQMEEAHSPPLSIYEDPVCDSDIASCLKIEELDTEYTEEQDGEEEIELEGVMCFDVAARVIQRALRRLAISLPPISLAAHRSSL